MAIKIIAFIVGLIYHLESYVWFTFYPLLHSNFIRKKYFFVQDTPKPELISIRALMLFIGDRQNTIHQSLLCSLSLLSVTVFTFLSLDCPSLTSTFFFFFLFLLLVSPSLQRAPLSSFLPSFLPASYCTFPLYLLPLRYPSISLRHSLSVHD